MKAITLSRSRVRDSYSNETNALFKQPDLVGWPHSFSQRPDLAWAYLIGLFPKWPWLNELFGSKEEYESSLHAYYLGLHVQELADLIASGQESVLESDHHMPLVPMQGVRAATEHGDRAYRKLVHSPEEVRAVWRTLGVKDGKMASSWEKWLKLTVLVNYRVTPAAWRQVFPHDHLFADVRPEEAK